MPLASCASGSDEAGLELAVAGWAAERSWISLQHGQL